MKLSTTSAITYGKIPRSKPLNRAQYYKARNIVECKANANPVADYPDYPTKPVPLIPKIPSVFKSSNLNMSAQSFAEKPRIAQAKPTQKPSDSQFERMYKTELQKNKNLENQLKLLQNALDRHNSDIKAMENHYSEFIDQLQSELKDKKDLEHKLDAKDKEKRDLENQLYKSNMELNMLKEANNNSDDNVISDLRERVRLLNKEKLELLDIIKGNRKELRNLRSEIKNCCEEHKRGSKTPSMQDESLQKQIDLKDKEIEDLKRALEDKTKDAEVLKIRDKEIEDLSAEINRLNNSIAKLKKDNNTKDSKIFELKTIPVLPVSNYTTSKNELAINEYSNRRDVRVSNEPSINRNSTMNEPMYFDRTNSPTKSYIESPPVERISVAHEPTRKERIPSQPRVIRRSMTPSVVRREIGSPQKCTCSNICSKCLNQPRYSSTLTTSPDSYRKNYYSPNRYSPNEYKSEYSNNERTYTHTSVYYPKVTTTVTRRPLGPERVYNTTSISDNNLSP